MGPARDLDEREKLRENIFFKCMFIKIIVFDLHITFFDSLNMFFRFQAEIRFRTIMKLPQAASFETKPCSFGTSITLP